MPQVQIRPAKPADLPQIRTINTHYILHTSLTFAQAPVAAETHATKYDDLRQRGLPYLVAVDTHEHRQEEVIVGYTYLSPFREQLLAYAPTVELTLFVHPEHHLRGIGSLLLGEVLGMLHRRVIFHCLAEDERTVVQNIIAVMAVDPEGKDGGEALRRWYLNRGFVERGRLEKVGFKRGFWIDTVYLQCSASGSES
ncbi:hypothetical protein N7532_010255 [Penicillium argentinense]|uniref:N-acetyltransferase domain-containing protein n=1 Tax=Penicillium argentinense TaxID=1131581 RepID=A0A9W9JXG6_9EURO|nr:uncharacterized protein N7532_010255 [Penicillium argentinense]KAJ5085484.1 hypothetical protein N7532_010255 [Penicillium argentinense]